jgi:hypothetical protein
MKPLLISALIPGSQLHAADALAKAEKPAPRPKIVLLLTDDLRDNTLGGLHESELDAAAHGVGEQQNQETTTLTKSI